uniref:Uncharacterized protein n=2 Tax=Cannabis sativa TaxID=3483 RepID=A0A803QUR6_CANSA
MLSESPNLTLIDSSLELAVYGHGSYLGFFVDQEEEQDFMVFPRCFHDSGVDLSVPNHEGSAVCAMLLLTV